MGKGERKRGGVGKAERQSGNGMVRGAGESEREEESLKRKGGIKGK